MTGNLSSLFEDIANELIVGAVVDVVSVFQTFDFGLLLWSELAENNSVSVNKRIVAALRGCCGLFGGDVRRGSCGFLFPFTAGILIQSELENTIGVSF